jgi:GT2 family glycosyltransferase
LSDRGKLAYRIIHIDLEQPLLPVTVPGGYSGLAFVVRYHDFPLGFFMEGLPAGSTLTSKDLAARMLRNVGAYVVREQIYEQLKKTPNGSGFPTFDIAICTRNRTDLLARCLQSLVKVVDDHPSRSSRILVIDNAPSDDRTKQLVAQFPDVRYVREPKPGLDCARNRAVMESAADLIGFLDDDVTVDRYWLLGTLDAWVANPDAGAFVGPVLPLQLDTRAQVLFEQRGGFGRHFESARFGSTLPGSPTYPYSAGMLGAGCNMVFKRQLLIDLGGFDEALDMGEPLPGGGDMDMFYRVVRAGHTLVRQPKMVVFHQHRREYAELRHQMWTWGLCTMAFITKCYRQNSEHRPKLRRWVMWWFASHLSKILAPSFRGDRDRWPLDLVVAELCGAAVGLFGAYDRALRHIADRQGNFE